MKQTRWQCHDCHREWVFSTTGDEACPRCQSASIERVTYTPRFPGADIRMVDVPGIPPISDPVPEIDTKQVHINENQTLALSCPEFA